jgi:hypothetical protein
MSVAKLKSLIIKARLRISSVIVCKKLVDTKTTTVALKSPFIIKGNNTIEDILRLVYWLGRNSFTRNNKRTDATTISICFAFNFLTLQEAQHTR